MLYTVAIEARYDDRYYAEADGPNAALEYALSRWYGEDKNRKKEYIKDVRISQVAAEILR